MPAVLIVGGWQVVEGPKSGKGAVPRTPPAECDIRERALWLSPHFTCCWGGKLRAQHPWNTSTDPKDGKHFIAQWNRGQVATARTSQIVYRLKAQLFGTNDRETAARPQFGLLVSSQFAADVALRGRGFPRSGPKRIAGRRVEIHSGGPQAEMEGDLVADQVRSEAR
jgi:hypothetical protein